MLKVTLHSSLLFAVVRLVTASAVVLSCAGHSATRTQQVPLSAEQRAEQSAYTEATRMGTPDAYKAFLREYPRSQELGRLLEILNADVYPTQEAEKVFSSSVLHGATAMAQLFAGKQHNSTTDVNVGFYSHVDKTPDGSLFEVTLHDTKAMVKWDSSGEGSLLSISYSRGSLLKIGETAVVYDGKDWRLIP